MMIMRYGMWFFVKVFVACLLLWVKSPAYASSIDISPLMIALSLQHPIQTVTINNLDDKPLTVEVKQYRWTQQQGQDHYEETKDLLISPPLIQIPAHQQQTLRIGMRVPKFSENELGYRLFIKEIAPHIAKKSKDTLALQMTLQVSLPVFVAAIHEPIQKLQINIKKQKNNPADVTFTNLGNTHVRVQHIIFKTAGGTPNVLATRDALFYLLPGAHHKELVSLKQAEAGSDVIVETDLGTETVINNAIIK